MRRSKYGAVRTTVDGITFASKKESRRYSELKLLLKAGKINSLELQPKFPIEVRGHKICTYIADFRYWPSGKYACAIVEDSKGMKTSVYRIKKKLTEALYGIKIIET